MKTLTNLFIALLAFYPYITPIRAQTRKPVYTDSLAEKFSRTIEAVLQDFPDNLRHLTGDLLLAQGEIENYACTVDLPGADNCTITRYHSLTDTSASWQARMYQGDNYSQASHAYGDMYNRLKNCFLLQGDGNIAYLKGNWEPAKEEAAFTTSTLRISTGDLRYRDVRVEIELLYLASDWVVNINIISKKPDDEPGI